MPSKCIHLEKIKEIIEKPWRQELTYGWDWNKDNEWKGEKIFMEKGWGSLCGDNFRTTCGGGSEGWKSIDYESYILLKVIPSLILGKNWNGHYVKGIYDLVNECNCENKNNQQLVLKRNTEIERNDLQVAKRNLESRISDLQSSNWNLERLVNDGVRELATKNNQIAEKDRQITTYSTQLTTAQSQLRDKDGQLTVSREEVRRVTELFNNLQIENNNKDNEIKTKEEKIVSLKVKLGEAEEDILSRELVSKEKKLDELTRDLAIEPPQRVKELREAYERLIKAREDYNRNGVAAAQRDIDERKQELLQTNISVDNLYKVYRNCEKVAELRIKLEKIHEQRFEARQEVPTNN